MVAGDEDTLVLDCYRLAEIYHQNPEVFLAMPFNDVRMHIMRTVQLRRAQAQASSNDG